MAGILVIDDIDDVTIPRPLRLIELPLELPLDHLSCGNIKCHRCCMVFVPFSVQPLHQMPQGRGLETPELFLCLSKPPIFFSIFLSATSHKMSPATKKCPIDEIVAWLPLLSVPPHP